MESDTETSRQWQREKERETDAVRRKRIVKLKHFLPPFLSFPCDGSLQ